MLRYISRLSFLLLLMVAMGTAARADFNPANPGEPAPPVVTPPAEKPHAFSLAAVPSFGGSVSGATASEYKAGAVISLKATPTTGYRFVGWEEGEGTVISTSASLSYTMPAHSVSLTARFLYDPSAPGEPAEPVIMRTLTLNANPTAGATVSGGGSYRPGSEVKVSCTLKTNYRFINWTDASGAVVAEAQSFTYTMPSGNTTLTANLEYHSPWNPGSPGEPGEPVIMRTLTLQAEPSEGGTVSGGGSYSPGAQVTVKATPKTNYTFLEWTDRTGMTVSEEAEFSYTMPSGNQTLTARFQYVKPPFNPSAPGEPGTPEPGGSTAVAPDMVVGPRFMMQYTDYLVILCETPGSTIYYTTDGSDPTPTTGTLYAGPVYVPDNILVKAMATAEGLKDSPIRSYMVRSHIVATPVIRCKKRQVVIECVTPGAVVRYTTDWSTPTEESEIYTGPLDLPDDTRVTAIGFKEGLEPSYEAIYPWRVSDNTLRTPYFTIHEDGLHMGHEQEGAVIRYTLDGTDPRAEGNNPLTYTAPIAVAKGTVVNAYAIHEDYFDSPTISFTVDSYILPTLKISSEESMGEAKVTIGGMTEGATVLYTLDGRTPTRALHEAEPQACRLYEGPFTLTESATVTARQFMDGYLPSAAVSAQVEVGPRGTVKVDLAISDDYEVSLTATPAEALVEYRFAGEPEDAWKTADTDSAGNAVIDCSGQIGLEVRASLENWLPFETVSIGKPTTPTLTKEEGMTQSKVTIDNILEGATVLYTLDGRTPTRALHEAEPQACRLYEGPFTLTESATVTARVFKEAYLPSESASTDVLVGPLGTVEVRFSQAEDYYVHLSATPAEALLEYRFTDDTEGEWQTTATDGSEPIDAFKRPGFAVRATLDRWLPFEETLFEFDFPYPAAEAPTGISFPVDDYLNGFEGQSEAVVFTLDGSEPRAQRTQRQGLPQVLNGEFFESAIDLKEYFDANDLDKLLVRAIGLTDGFEPSPEYSMTIYRVPRPVVKVEGIEAWVECPMPEGFAEEVAAQWGKPGESAAVMKDLSVWDESSVTVFGTTLGERSEIGAGRDETLVAEVQSHYMVTSRSSEPVEFKWLDHKLPTLTITPDYDKGTVALGIAPASDTDPRDLGLGAYQKFGTLTAKGSYHKIGAADDEGLPVWTGFEYTLEEFAESLGVQLPPTAILGALPLATLLSQASAIDVDGTLLGQFDGFWMQLSAEGWYESNPTEIRIDRLPAPEIRFDGRELRADCPGAEMIHLFDKEGLNSIDLEPGGCVTPLLGERYTARPYAEEKFRHRVSEPIDIETLVVDDEKFALRLQTTGQDLDWERAFAFLDSDGREELTALALEGEFSVWPEEGSDIDEMRRLFPELTRLDLGRASFPRNEEWPADSDVFSELTTSWPQSVRYLVISPDMRARENSSQYANVLEWEMPNPEVSPYGRFKEQLPLVWMHNDFPEEQLLEEGQEGYQPNVVLKGNCKRFEPSPLGFHASKRFRAEELVFERRFSNETPDPAVGGCQGWYSLVLPFTVEKVEGMVEGEWRELRPLAENQAEPPHEPSYWLVRASDLGWLAHGTIEAGVPCLISFPNHPNYPSSVMTDPESPKRFTARNFTVKASDELVTFSSLPGQMELRGILENPDAREHSFLTDGFWGLNTGVDTGETFGELPGSVFHSEAPLHVYEAAVSGNLPNAAFLPVFGWDSSSPWVAEVAEGVSVEVCGRSFRIRAAEERMVGIFTTSGLEVERVAVRGGETAISQELLPGLYIVEGRKFVIR